MSLCGNGLSPSYNWRMSTLQHFAIRCNQMWSKLSQCNARTSTWTSVGTSYSVLCTPKSDTRFLAPLAVGQRAYVMACYLASIHLCVCLCVNFFFKHLLHWNYSSDFDEISQKCSCHGPLQNLLKEFDSFKNCGCHGNKTEIFLKSLKIFLSETIRPRATKFGM